MPNSVLFWNPFAQMCQATEAPEPTLANAVLLVSIHSNMSSDLSGILQNLNSCRGLILGTKTTPCSRVTLGAFGLSQAGYGSKISFPRVHVCFTSFTVNVPCFPSVYASLGNDSDLTRPLYLFLCSLPVRTQPQTRTCWFTSAHLSQPLRSFRRLSFAQAYLLGIVLSFDYIVGSGLINASLIPCGVHFAINLDETLCSLRCMLLGYLFLPIARSLLFQSVFFEG